MNFGKLVAEDIRLCLLRVLEQDEGYAHNDGILQSALGMVGHDVSRDRVRTELHWLKEQGLVTVEDVGNLVVAKLTARGADVAKGRSLVPGVKRPGPED